MYAMYFVAIGSLAALVFAACMFVRVKRQPGGSPEMQRISGSVQKGDVPQISCLARPCRLSGGAGSR